MTPLLSGINFLLRRCVYRLYGCCIFTWISGWGFPNLSLQCAKLTVGVHVRCPSLPSNCNQNQNVSTHFSKISHYQISLKSVQSFWSGHGDVSGALLQVSVPNATTIAHLYRHFHNSVNFKMSAWRWTSKTFSCTLTEEYATHLNMYFSHCRLKKKYCSKRNEVRDYFL